MEPISWRELISAAMESHGDSWNDVESCTLTDLQLDEKFDDSFGATNGRPFTLWTKRRVYFPAKYDGAEWCGSVPRHPNGEGTGHVGGY